MLTKTKRMWSKKIAMQKNKGVEVPNVSVNSCSRWTICIYMYRDPDSCMSRKTKHSNFQKERFSLVPFLNGGSVIRIKKWRYYEKHWARRGRGSNTELRLEAYSVLLFIQLKHNTAELIWSKVSFLNMFGLFFFWVLWE